MCIEINKKDPLVSVCVTTYNRWDKCIRTIKSIINQTYSNIEIILVDDNSRDLPPPIMIGLINQYQIKYIRHDSNKGLASARNTAIYSSTGKFFSFCDDDDSWNSDMLEKLLHIPSDSDMSDKIEISIGLSEIYRSFYNRFIKEKELTLKQTFLLGITPPVGAQLYLKSLLLQVNGYNEKIKSGVDHDLWIRMLCVNPQVNIVVGLVANVESDYITDRMTTNEVKRKAGILESLSIWKNEIEFYLGQEYFEKFHSTYLLHIEKKFIHIEKNNKNYYSLVKRVIKPSILYHYSVIKSRELFTGIKYPSFY